MSSARRAAISVPVSGNIEGKLLAAVAAGDVAPAHAAFQQIPNRRQNDVAGLVPVGIVDPLEAIEIDEHDRHRRRVAAGSRELARQELAQIAAVVQAGQRVRDRLLLGEIAAPESRSRCCKCAGHVVERMRKLAELFLAIADPGARVQIPATHPFGGAKERPELAQHEPLRPEPNTHEEKRGRQRVMPSKSRTSARFASAKTRLRGTVTRTRNGKAPSGFW